MSRTAVDPILMKVIDLSDELLVQSEDDVGAKFSGKRFGCIHCIRALDIIRHGYVRTDEAILASIDPESLPLEKSFRRSYSYEKYEEVVKVPPHFSHLPGKGMSKVCESSESRHHDFCLELARGKRNLLFSPDPPNLCVTTMARYIKDPNHREPDISFLVAESPAIAKTLQKEIDDGKHRTLDFDGYDAWLAVEVQLSKLTVPEYISRTQDHRKHFKDVIWIFHQHFLSNVRDVRAHMDKIGVTAWVIKEEKGGSFCIEELPFKKYKKNNRKLKSPDICYSSLVMLAQTQVDTIRGAIALAQEWETKLRNGEAIQPQIPGTII